jgi:hypothetical protein
VAIPWRELLVCAGIAQLVLVVASLAIPRLLSWKVDLAKLRPLTRQVFWTYAGYIWVTNLSFGLLSTMAPDLLLDRSFLAGLVCSFIAVYWGARLVIQFAYFDRNDAPKGWFFVLAEVALVALFVVLTIVYFGLAARAFGVLAR